MTDMFEKHLVSALFDDRPIATLLGIHSRGFDRGQMQKLAADEALWKAGDIKPEKGYGFVHVITNGAGEVYGSNANFDYFNERARRHVFPQAPKGHEKSAMLEGGLVEYHRTYIEHGGVYRGHNNSRKKDPRTGSPFEKSGDVFREGYNQRLHRGELILRLPEAQWGDVFDKMATDRPVFWSMATSVPRDICSQCGNKARSRAEYCPHLNFMMGKVAEDGTLVCALNDITYYHDISEVDVPAAKMAWALEKVAACGFSPMDGDSSGLLIPVDMLRRMSPSARIPGEAHIRIVIEKGKAVDSDPGMRLFGSALRLPLDDEADAARSLCGLPFGDALSQTMSANQLLTPRIFAIMLCSSNRNSDPAADGNAEWPHLVPEEVRKASGTLEEPGEAANLLSDASYVPASPDARPCRTVSDLQPTLGISPEDMRSRSLKALAAVEPEHDKEASAHDRNLARYAAREYLKYQMAFLASSGDREYAATAIAAANRMCV